MKIALTLRELVDLKGVSARMDSEIRQGLYTEDESVKNPNELREEFQDWGLVEYEGELYYMSSRIFSAVEVEENESD